MSWDFSIGNLAQRATNDPAAVSPATTDTILPLTNLATGYPDQEASFVWRADGNYAVLVDLNLLANTSERTDAPTGYRDLLLDYAGTPGLGTYPPDWGNHAARTALRAFRPVFQDIEVMPGENMTISGGIYLHANSTATGAQVRVTNTTTGLSWDGTNSAWEDGGIVELMSNTASWDDFTETIVTDANFAIRGTYRVILEPIANTYGDTTYVYLSGNGGNTAMPAVYGELDFVALVGHNLPATADVDCGNFAFTTLDVPTAIATGNSEITQQLTLSVQMPAGNQPRPKIGELWIGRKETFTRGPDPGIDVREGDVNQIRVSAGGGRQEVLSDMRIPARAIGMKVRTFTDAAYTQYRDRLTRGTKFGADPILLIPPTELEGEVRPIHGRVGPVTGYKHAEAGWREFTVELSESPFSGS